MRGSSINDVMSVVQQTSLVDETHMHDWHKTVQTKEKRVGNESKIKKAAISLFLIRWLNPTIRYNNFSVKTFSDPTESFTRSRREGFDESEIANTSNKLVKQRVHLMTSRKVKEIFNELHNNIM